MRSPCLCPHSRDYFHALTVERTRIAEGDIERYMMTSLGGSPPLDVLIRSSGVKRLSDFLMWQVSSNFPRSRDLPRMIHKLFVGFGGCSTSFRSDILARHWGLGFGASYSGLPSEGVESAGEQLGTQAMGKFRSQVQYVPGLPQLDDIFAENLLPVALVVTVTLFASFTRLRT